jgi:mersacidin/lichenicidin family type 2 lantibiotic
MAFREIIRALKDKGYGYSLSEKQPAVLPEHPAGLMELADAELDAVQGAGSGLVVDRDGPICMAIVVTTPDDCRGVPDPLMP